MQDLVSVLPVRFFVQPDTAVQKRFKSSVASGMQSDGPGPVLEQRRAKLALPLTPIDRSRFNRHN
jgi:hypothetical protein